MEIALKEADKKLTILVVGGAGYIGSHMVDLLLRSGYSVIVFDNLSTGHADAVPGDILFIGDLASMEDLNACFKKYTIDVVMHFAANALVAESVQDPGKYYRNNVINTVNLLDVMRAHHVNRFIFSSTCAVYGNPIEVPISVNHPKNPVNPYGRSKAMVEEVLKDYQAAYDLQYISLRYFNAAGADPGGKLGERHAIETHLIPIALQVANQKREMLEVYGTDYETKDGSCVRDYIHICDLANAHLLAMHYLIKTSQSRVFNLGTGVGHSVKEVIHAVENVTGKNIPVRISDRRPGDPPELVADAVLAANELKWSPQYSLNEMIEHAWNFELMHHDALVTQ
jgi:UDP-glucose 4-epimerase